MEMNGLVFFLLVVLASGLGHLAGERLQRALDARQAVPDGYPAVVEREGVWWVYVHGQGWTETNRRHVHTVSCHGSIGELLCGFEGTR